MHLAGRHAVVSRKPKRDKHARIELAPANHAIVEEDATKAGLSVAAHLRMAVPERAREDLFRIRSRAAGRGRLTGRVGDAYQAKGGSPR